ncbi:MAG: hypothetical protein HRT43_08640 [Campylobacteraceae bacterium]|nr:hypothetical protein [Campylobacteraceae bacterium]
MSDFAQLFNKIKMTNYVYIPNKRIFKFKRRAIVNDTFLAEEILFIMDTIEKNNESCTLDRFHNIILD